MQFHVQNMTCGGCARGVTKAVQTVDPQARIDIDLDARRIDLTTTQPAAAFVAALDVAGFQAVPA